MSGRQQTVAESTAHPTMRRANANPVRLLHTTWSWALAGMIAVVVGTLVALDYRGVAARIPWILGVTRWGFNRSVAGRRRAFAGVALWGVMMMLLALAR